MLFPTFYRPSSGFTEPIIPSLNLILLNTTDRLYELVCTLLNVWKLLLTFISCCLFINPWFVRSCMKSVTSLKNSEFVKSGSKEHSLPAINSCKAGSKSLTLVKNSIKTGGGRLPSCGSAIGQGSSFSKTGACDYQWDSLCSMIELSPGTLYLIDCSLRSDLTMLSNSKLLD